VPDLILIIINVGSGQFKSKKNLFCVQCYILYSDTMTEVTVDEMARYISGNVKRKQVLDVLDKNGSVTSEALRKLTRMPKVMLEKTLENMEKNGIVIKQNDSFILTANGKKAANVLPKQSNQASGNRFDSHIRREI